jgi:hypothetical protein
MKQFDDLLKGTLLEPYSSCIYKSLTKVMTKNQFKEFCQALKHNCKKQNNLDDFVTCIKKYIHVDTWKDFKYQEFKDNLQTCNIEIKPEDVMANIFAKFIEKCNSYNKDQFVNGIKKILYMICAKSKKQIDDDALTELTDYLKNTNCNEITKDDLLLKLVPVLMSCAPDPSPSSY